MDIPHENDENEFYGVKIAQNRMLKKIKNIKFFKTENYSFSTYAGPFNFLRFPFLLFQNVQHELNFIK